MNRKGVELPLNTLVILILAMVILVAALSIFSGTFGPGKQSTDAVGVYNSACVRYTASGCCSATSYTGSGSCGTIYSDYSTAASGFTGLPTTATGFHSQCCAQ